MGKDIKKIILTIPQKSGIYQYFDKEGKLLYVGKAKSLKNRVSSYFNNDRSKSGRLRLLVSKIADIKYIITNTELDALLLENTLIKKHQPRYNIMLKDDKTYPWICIKNEPYPRVFKTRTIIEDGSEYFGPYASVKMMNTVLDLVRKTYKLRNCNYYFSKKNIENRKYKLCLEYHIGNCKGPCEGLQNKESYDQSIEQIRSILKGDLNSVKSSLKLQMKIAAKELDFENAQSLKEKIEQIKRFQIKSTVVSPSIHNVDVFSILEDQDLSYVNYIKVLNGSVVQGHTIELKKRLDETIEELLQVAIIELRNRFNSNSREIIVPFIPSFAMEGIKFHKAQRGDKKKLLELSERNSKYFMLDRRKQHEKTDPERHTKRILEGIKKDLRLNKLPVHIECFDNSNIQGSNPTSACVVFKNGKPSKKDYRHFNIKTVEGPNDFASMEEAVYRRYKRLQDEEEFLPQLIIIDGGKGQLSSALKSLDKLGLRGEIAIVGIAKRLEEIFYPGDTLPLFLDKKSESLKVIQHLRNEAHRFSLKHHRNRRSKNGLISEIENINGVGQKTAQKLLKKFKSVKRIKEANAIELKETVGEKLSENIIAYFKN